MILQTVITLFNAKAGADRREVFFPTVIDSASYMSRRASSSSKGVHTEGLTYSLRIPVNAKVIDESKVGTDKVQLLNKVKVQNIALGTTMEFTIVGESEADFAHGKLAATTPIAKALLGHGKGEVVDAVVPSGVMKLKILDISI